VRITAYNCRVQHSTAQNSSDNLSYLTDNRSDAVYCRQGKTKHKITN